MRNVKRKGYKAWTWEVGFGRRWTVETAIGSFKALFGEYMMTAPWKMPSGKLGLKVAVY